MYDHPLPGGLTIAAFRGHPVRQAIRDAAHHGPRALPTKAELDELGLSAEVRQRVERACADVAEVQATGDHQAAWEAGDRLAAEIVGELPEGLRRPDNRQPEDLSGLGPKELAAKVPRMYDVPPIPDDPAEQENG